MNLLERKILKIDWKCLWKLTVEDKNSSTFEIVRADKNHNLNPCLSCTGYDNKCIGYRNYEMNKINIDSFREIKK